MKIVKNATDILQVSDNIALAFLKMGWEYGSREEFEAAEQVAEEEEEDEE